MMMITTTPKPLSKLAEVHAFDATRAAASPRPAAVVPGPNAWPHLCAELAASTDERNRYGITWTHGGTTTTGNDRSFAICGMYVPAFAKKEHSQRKRPT